MDTAERGGDIERGHIGGRERREGVGFGGGKDFSCGREKEGNYMGFKVEKGYLLGAIR